MPNKTPSRDRYQIKTLSKSKLKQSHVSTRIKRNSNGNLQKKLDYEQQDSPTQFSIHTLNNLPNETSMSDIEIDDFNTNNNVDGTISNEYLSSPINLINDNKRKFDEIIHVKLNKNSKIKQKAKFVHILTRRHGNGKYNVQGKLNSINFLTEAQIK